MIEVEKKFYSSPKILTFLKEEAELVGEAIIHDIYFDTPDFKLAHQNCWFRNRNGSFELKIPTKDFDAEMNTYHEIEDELEIIQELGLDVDELSIPALLDAGYVEFLNIESLRKKYEYQDFKFDLDTTNFNVEQLECELLVDDESEVQEATKRIIDLLFSIDENAALSKVGKARHLIIENYPELDKEMVAKGYYEPLEL